MKNNLSFFILLVLFCFLSLFSTNAFSYKPVVAKKGSPAACQPEFFDPQTTKYSLASSGHYEVTGSKYKFLINGIIKNNDKPIQLASGLELKYYHFVCASEQSFVIEIFKNKKRQNLFTHINNFISQKSLSKDKKRIYLYNSIKLKSDAWQLLARIIDVELNTKKSIPLAGPCVSRFGFFSDNQLITYSNKGEWDRLYTISNPDSYKTKICVWSESGSILHQINKWFPWMAAGSWALYSTNFGVIPHNPDIFYSVQPNFGMPKGCHLELTNLKDSEQAASYQLSKSDNYDCGELTEVDLSSITGIKPKTKIRFREKTARRANWGAWQELLP
jgi:hypothetical protein